MGCVLLASVVCCAVSACDPKQSKIQQNLSPAQRFSGEWIPPGSEVTDQELSLQRTLIANHAQDCGENYYYRWATDDDQELLVYCHGTGPVTAYIAHTSANGEIGTLSAPHVPYAGIPFPKFCCSDDSVPPPKEGSFPPSHN